MRSMTPDSARKQATTKKRQPKRTYNSYNIYFMLERQLLLHSRGGMCIGDDAATIGTKRREPLDVTTLSADVRRFVDLDLPPLCGRYADLPLSPNGWFVELIAKRDEKRVHKKSHGLVPFVELAKIVAKNHKDADEETKGFVKDVAERLAAFCAKLEAAEERERVTRTRTREESRIPPQTFSLGTARNTGSDINVTNVDRLGSFSQYNKDLFKKAMSYLPLASHVNIKAMPDAEMERLRLELALAVSSRVESERKVSILRSELEVKKERERESETWTRLGEESRIPPTGNDINAPNVEWLDDIALPNVDAFKKAMTYLHLTSHFNIKDAELEQLRLELVRAVSSRVDSERKVGIFRSVLENYHARQLDQDLRQRQQDAHGQYLHQEQHQQRHRQQQERSRDHWPPKKRHRSSGTNEYQTKDAAVIGERVVDPSASSSSSLLTSYSTFSAFERSSLSGQVTIDYPQASSPYSLLTSSLRNTAFERSALADPLVASWQVMDRFLSHDPGQVPIDDPPASPPSSLSTSSSTITTLERPALADSLVASRQATNPSLARGLGQVTTHLYLARGPGGMEIRRTDLPPVASRSVFW